MNIKFVAQILAVITLIITAGMIPSAVIAVVGGENDVVAFLLSIAAGVAVSGAMWWYSGGREAHSGLREGIAITGFSWFVASFIGALPFYISGFAPTFPDAFFEAASGFTTTGATILNDIESVPKSLLLWRSLTHWFGGMGIIVLSIAILPFLNFDSSAFEMYKAEVPGITAGKITPRLHQTAVRLWGVYVALTLTEALLLCFGGMTVFDAICHSFSTIATGGFSTKNASIAYYKSSYIQWVIIIFMFLSGVNFSLYFDLRSLFKDSEFRCYAVIAFVSSALIAVSLYSHKMLGDLAYVVRQSVFHVVTVMTTTGFIIEDYDFWPEFTKIVIIMLMFIGACGGSTGGGCKVSRFMILWSCLRSEVKKLLHPRAVITPRFSSKPLEQDTLNSTVSFFVLFMMMLFASTLVLAAYDIDIITAFTSVLTCLSNVGPGLHKAGATESFSHFPSAVKLLLSFCMLAGRLELFAVYLLFVRNTYRK